MQLAFDGTANDVTLSFAIITSATPQVSWSRGVDPIIALYDEYNLGYNDKKGH